MDQHDIAATDGQLSRQLRFDVDFQRLYETFANPSATFAQLTVFHQASR